MCGGGRARGSTVPEQSLGSRDNTQEPPDVLSCLLLTEVLLHVGLVGQPALGTPHEHLLTLLQLRNSLGHLALSGSESRGRSRCVDRGLIDSTNPLSGASFAYRYITLISHNFSQIVVTYHKLWCCNHFSFHSYGVHDRGGTPIGWPPGCSSYLGV